MQPIHFVRPATRGQAAALLFSVVGPFEGQNIQTLSTPMQHRVRAAIQACKSWFGELEQAPIALASVRHPEVHHG